MVIDMLFTEWERLVIPQKREPTELGRNGLILFQATGLAGEAGEVANEAKKLARDGLKVDSWTKIVDECGDNLFYMQRLLQLGSLGVEDAAKALLRKLDGMSAAAKHRAADCPVCQSRICKRM